MKMSVLNSRSFFIAFGIIIFCMLTFIAVHQPQQPFTTGIIGGGGGGVDDRLIPLRVDDFIIHISEKVLDGIRNEKLICSESSSSSQRKKMKVEFGSSSSSSSTASVVGSSKKKLPTIYIITPTYKRPEQIPDLTRLSHTLMHVPSILWIIVEDAEVLNPNVAEIAKRSGIPFIHLIGPMPKEEQKKKVKARGVSNRNRGLEWIRENDVDPNGVIYFADDDNTYDLRLFEEIRRVKKLGMFPVGLITSTGVSTPIVKDGLVTGFYDGWIANRKFPVDMAGFCFSVNLLLKKPKAKMPFIPGYEEDRFLQSLELKQGDIEPKADNCTKIYVWHTQTKKNKPPVKAKGTFENTNIETLYKYLES